MNGYLNNYSNGNVQNNNDKKNKPEMTEAERLLWTEIRQKKLGINFERKVKIGPYVVDFFAPKAKLVIQMNRRRHETEEGKRKDAAFDDYYKKKGYKVLRFTSHEAVANINGVIQRLWLQLHQMEVETETEEKQS